MQAGSKAATRHGEKSFLHQIHKHLSALQLTAAAMPLTESKLSRVVACLMKIISRVASDG